MLGCIQCTQAWGIHSNLSSHACVLVHSKSHSLRKGCCVLCLGALIHSNMLEALIHRMLECTNTQHPVLPSIGGKQPFLPMLCISAPKHGRKGLQCIGCTNTLHPFLLSLGGLIFSILSYHAWGGHRMLSCISALIHSTFPPMDGCNTQHPFLQA